MRPIAWVGLQALLLVLGLMSLVWNAAALLLGPWLPPAARLRLGRAVIAHGYRAFWCLARVCRLLELDATALDVLRDEPRLIIAANHPSMLDAPMLISRLPRSACIMKGSLLRNPLLGPAARLACYITNDSLFHMIKRAVQDLQNGGQLVLFPEGTRTTRRPVNAFHGSFTVIAERAAAPIQTVFIDTDSPYLGKGWPLWRLPPLPIRFSARLGRRFEPMGGNPETLARDIEAYFATGLSKADAA